MISRHVIQKLFALASIAFPSTLLAQNIPPQPTARQGLIIDVSSDPVLSKLAVRHVSYEFDGEPAQIAVAAISTDAAATNGVSMKIWTGPYKDMDGQLVTMHLKQAPFMEGLMEIRQQLRARVKEVDGSVVTLGYAPDEEIPPWCVAGPFAISFMGISNQLGMFYGPGEVEQKPTSRVMMNLDWWAEPGIVVVQSGVDVKCVDLKDDKGQAIGLKMDSSRTFPRGELVLTLPENPGRKIPLLKGTMDMKVARVVQVDLANVTEKQTPPAVEGMTMETSPLVDRDGRGLFFKMDVKYHRGTMPEEKWKILTPFLMQAQMRITGNHEGAISSRPAPSPRAGTVKVGDDLTVNYGVTIGKGDGPPGTARIFVPVDLTDVRVPFEFRDVIIP